MDQIVISTPVALLLGLLLLAALIAGVPGAPWETGESAPGSFVLGVVVAAIVVAAVATQLL